VGHSLVQNDPTDDRRTVGLAVRKRAATEIAELAEMIVGDKGRNSAVIADLVRALGRSMEVTLADRRVVSMIVAEEIVGNQVLSGLFASDAVANVDLRNANIETKRLRSPRVHMLPRRTTGFASAADGTRLGRGEVAVVGVTERASGGVLEECRPNSSLEGHNAINVLAARGVAIEAEVVFELTANRDEVGGKALVALDLVAVNDLAHIKAVFTKAVRDRLTAKLVELGAIVRAKALVVERLAIDRAVHSAQERLPVVEARIVLQTEGVRRAALSIALLLAIPVREAAFDRPALTCGQHVVDAIAVVCRIAAARRKRRAVDGPRLLRELAVVRVKGGRPNAVFDRLVSAGVVHLRRDAGQRRARIGLRWDVGKKLVLRIRPVAVEVALASRGANASAVQGLPAAPLAVHLVRVAA